MLGSRAIIVPLLFGATFLLGSALAFDVCAPQAFDLGVARKYAILAASSVTNTGFSTITGDLGNYPGTAVPVFTAGTGPVASTMADCGTSLTFVCNSPPCCGTGLIQAGNTNSQIAQAAILVALTGANQNIADEKLKIVAPGDPQCVTDLGGIVQLGGLTLSPGIYTASQSMEITSGTLYLSGDPSSIFIFKMPTTLNLTPGMQIVLQGGVQPKNIFWIVGTGASLGVNSKVYGNIIAGTLISFATGANLDGRAYAGTAITLDAAVVGLIPSSPVVTPPLPGSNVCAPQPLDLGIARRYATLASTAVTNIGISTITGDLGCYPGTAVPVFTTGTAPAESTMVECGNSSTFLCATPPCCGTGLIEAGNYYSKIAKAAILVALSGANQNIADEKLKVVAPGHVQCVIGLGGIVQLGGRVLSPGIYTSTNSMEITSGTLYLMGNASSLFIFKMPSTLNVSLGMQIILEGDVQPKNIFWMVGTAARLGVGSQFYGNIIAGTLISLATGASLNGRAYAGTAITLDSAVIGLTPGWAHEALWGCEGLC